MQTEPPEVSVVETQYEAEPTISEETQTTILEFMNSQTMTNSVMLDVTFAQKWVNPKLP